MPLAVHLLGPTGRPSRLQSFQTSPPPFGQPARDTTPVQIQQIRDLQNPPSLFVGLDSPEAHVFQYVVCQGPSIERHTQPIEYYPMEVKRNITLIMKRQIDVVSRSGEAVHPGAVPAHTHWIGRVANVNHIQAAAGLRAKFKTTPPTSIRQVGVVAG